MYLGVLLAFAAISSAATVAGQDSSPRQPDGAPPDAASAASPVFPGERWETVADPALVGYSPARLDGVRARLRDTNPTGLMVVVGGRVLLQYGDVERPSPLFSARKSVTSMLYGNYVLSGKIRLDRTLREMGIDDIGGLLPQEREATVEHLLTARSGVYHPAANLGDNLPDAPPRGSQRPGTYYLYNNWDFNALGTIFERETGRDFYDAIETDIVRPIGMQDWRRGLQRRTNDTKQSEHPACHLVFSTRDMARLGYLMLREGRWGDRRVIPGDWVRRSTRAVTHVADMNPPKVRRGHAGGYGYLWWVWEGREPREAFEGAYLAQGAYGQFIAVLPRLDMVVAHKVDVSPYRPERQVIWDEFERLMDAIVGARESERPR